MANMTYSRLEIDKGRVIYREYSELPSYQPTWIANRLTDINNRTGGHYGQFSAAVKQLDEADDGKGRRKPATRSA